MSSYKELNALPAESFLNPENFITEYDSLPQNQQYKSKQFQHGLEISQKADHIAIGENSTWSAAMKDGSFLSSYEGIGYHAATSDLLRGFLAGPARIVVYRYDGKKSTRTVIRN